MVVEMIDFSIGFRNGFGIDLSLQPKQVGLGISPSGETAVITAQMFELLLPFVYFQIGEINFRPIEGKDSELLSLLKGEKRDDI